MPTYTYACRKCDAEFDLFHGFSETPKLSCKACGSRSVQRLIGGGSGIIFKGSGFYETDYKRKGNPNAVSESKAESKSESKGETKPEVKADTPKKSEPKAAAAG
jgi:putative FmdB family regulatory protein